VSFGVDHKIVPLATLDLLTPWQTEGFGKFLRRLPGVKGSVTVKTCNRIEFYLDTEDRSNLDDMLLSHWAAEAEIGRSRLSQIVRKRKNKDVVEHIVRLGSGLESMLVGEPQILGQLKAALDEAQTQGQASGLLTELFQKGIKAAAKIRHMTGMAQGTVSIGSAAVKLAENSLGDLRHLRTLVIGPGHVGMLVTKALRARNMENVVVAGRTPERAKVFCQSYGGIPIGISQFRRYVSSSRLVIVATSARNYLLTKEDLIDSSDKIGHSKRVVLDLSVPRNVSPDVAEVDGVVLKTLEDIKDIVSATLKKREGIVIEAGSLARTRAKEIFGFLNRKDAEPIVSGIYQRAEQVRAEILRKTIARLSLEPDEERILEKMTFSLVERILEKPARHVRMAAEKGDHQVLLVAREVFRGEFQRENRGRNSSDGSKKPSNESVPVYAGGASARRESSETTSCWSEASGNPLDVVGNTLPCRVPERTLDLRQELYASFFQIAADCCLNRR
jgi:glutamyl-tRNA reductase